MSKNQKNTRDKIKNPNMNTFTTPNMPDPATDPIVCNNIVNAEFDYTYDSNRDNYTKDANPSKKHR